MRLVWIVFSIGLLVGETIAGYYSSSKRHHRRSTVAHSSRLFAAEIQGGYDHACELSTDYGFQLIRKSSLGSDFYLLRESSRRSSGLLRYRRHYASPYRKSKSNRGRYRSRRRPNRIAKDSSVKHFWYQQPLRRTKREFMETTRTPEGAGRKLSLTVVPDVGKVVNNISNPNNPLIKAIPSFNFSDTEWKKMWYLQYRPKAGNMRIEEAWKSGYTGKGAVVSILDDGLERDHPDLANNFNWVASKDINDGDDDPMPRYTRANENKHGTRCAGIVAAQQDNKNCIVGIAHGATIGGVKMLDGEVNDMVEAEALTHEMDYVHIYSASWGPDDNGKTVDGPRELAAKAFENGAKFGRRGLGSIYVWASGNGGSAYDSCSCDGYTNSIYTISVSSANNNGQEPWYAEHCANILTTAYSSGDSRDGRVHTTDLRWRCTDSHTGTSASAPMVAAIMALTLEANFKLSWRDLQHILVRTSRHEHLQANDWAKNGAGHWYSHIFGFGLIDALGMVKVAEVWTEVPPQLVSVMPIDDTDYALSNRAATEVSQRIYRNMTKIDYLEHVQLRVSITAPRRGDLSIELISPVGTRSTILPQRAQDRSFQGFPNWTFMSVHFWGENPLGVWQIRVIDNAPQIGPKHRTRALAAKKLLSWQLIFRGTQYDPQDGFDVAAMEKAISSPSRVHAASFVPPAGHTVVDAESDHEPDTDLVRETSILRHRANQCNPERVQEFVKGDCSELCDPSYGCCGPKPQDCFLCRSAVSNDRETCMKSCPPEMYPHGQHKVCQLCRPECKTCSVNAANCTSCFPFSRLEIPETLLGSCESQCEEVGFYIDRAGVCQKCHPSCAKCSGPNVDQCMRCSLNRFYNQGHCVTRCPPGWYGHTPVNSCLRCHDNCDTCYGNSEHQCLECADGLLKGKEGSCQFQCIDRINPSLCHNLAEFCDVKLVNRSCCASCDSHRKQGSLRSTTLSAPESSSTITGKAPAGVEVGAASSGQSQSDFVDGEDRRTNGEWRDGSMPGNKKKVAGEAWKDKDAPGRQQMTNATKRRRMTVRRRGVPQVQRARYRQMRRKVVRKVRRARRRRYPKRTMRTAS